MAKKQRKKRRTREPFVLISEWKGERREETRWHFSKEDIQKDVDKFLKNQHYFFFNEKSTRKGNPDYDPTNYKLIDIVPYPKKWNVLLNNGSKTHDIMTCVDAQTEEEAKKLIKKKYPNHKLLEIKQGLQIIDY